MAFRQKRIGAQRPKKLFGLTESRAMDLKKLLLLVSTVMLASALSARAQEDEDYEGDPEDGASWASEDTGSDIYQAVFGKALVFQHPKNGAVYLYPSNGNWYLMRSNNPRTGEPMGEGGKWSVQENMLCIDTAINYPDFAGCGELRLSSDGRQADWDHPFASGLRIHILTLEEVNRH